MNKRTKYLILACLVPVVILLGMTVTPLYTLYNGDEITLQTVPVDPSDVFRGDYVALQYEAEQVSIDLVDKGIKDKWEKEFNPIQVYVTLEKKNDVFTPIKVSVEKPEKGIFLKGKLNYIDYAMDTKEYTQVKSAFIEYSLDKYFVEDNTGTDWEKASAKGEIIATVKVFNGYATLTNITKKK
ncbi:MAG: hypothetical protein K0S25_1234 [Bacillus sp. (in: firmicutes)]|jgi:uncharacterized membrane-anchored protein|nr:hypothetical protein [Bacillus sp. (in: firmicutes)]